MSRSLPRRVLIANRGEIAVRVARTCRVVGVETVAVHTAADAAAPHLGVTDAAVSVDSYLDADGLVAAAASAACDAIHPGYGFLAENAGFARAVEEAGLVFVGPSAASMEVMGSKTEARRAMEDAGVPVVPGTEPGSAGELAERAEEIGYPVLVKAVAGGGGKGMHAVRDAGELEGLVRRASQEAERAFGDGSVYLEKLLERPRHVEVQVFGDSAGRVVALGERECSIQRRHQKIVEESPSPAVDDELRRRMSRAAVDAGRAVDYQGAGTVEFLLDSSGDFYFLEMNTRLQVEHPVTEMVTGLDLVHLQLEVAGGRGLDELLGDLSLEDDLLLRRGLHGHAVECRVYAEDPAADHLPQSGRLLLVREPAAPGIRVDAALAEGLEVGVDYDPLLAKVVAWGADRDTAVARCREALARFVILGVTTNLDHLQDVLDHPEFRSGDLSTAFLDEHMAGWGAERTPPEIALAATALPAAAPSARGAGGLASGTAGRAADPWRRLGRFRLGPGGRS